MYIILIKNKYNDLQTEVKYFIPKDKKYKVIRINFKNLSTYDKLLKEHQTLHQKLFYSAELDFGLGNFVNDAITGARHKRIALKPRSAVLKRNRCLRAFHGSCEKTEEHIKICSALVMVGKRLAATPMVRSAM